MKQSLTKSIAVPRCSFARVVPAADFADPARLVQNLIEPPSTPREAKTNNIKEPFDLLFASLGASAV
jgi:hypothetical protein